MAAVACAGAFSGALAQQWAPPSSSASSSAVSASRSVAFRGASLAVKPLRSSGRLQDNRVQGWTVRASAEGAGEGELVLNKPEGSGKKVSGKGMRVWRVPAACELEHFNAGYATCAVAAPALIRLKNYLTCPRCKFKKKVVIAAPKKQRVLLRFLWLEKNIGIALDQVVPGHGTIPLSPYFFWPRKDAWEQLKTKLDSKGWISRKRTIILLNQATDIINLWQANAANL